MRLILNPFEKLKNRNFMDQLNPKTRLRFEGGWAITILTIFSLLVIFFFWNLAPVEPGARSSQIFEVTYGASLRNISHILEKRGIIRNGVVFEIFVRLNPEKRMSKAGNYLIGPGMSVPRIVSELGRGVPRATRITIPEGLTLQETADLLAGKGLVDREKFIKLASDSNFVNGILKDIPVKNGAEGCLFPDTYEFNLNVSEPEIITQMLRQFEKVFQRNFHAIPDKKRLETVIMASIVEKEAKNAEERPVIAGVFYNRLRRDYPLQSCATIQYALGKRKERLLYKDLQIQSDYNTYTHLGLPPGPIASPGLESLKAAAFPLDVPYLFFVAKSDGTHVFSNTYKEHMQAQKRLSRGRAAPSQ
jgi:UPF0755 protein